LVEKHLGEAGAIAALEAAGLRNAASEFIVEVIQWLWAHGEAWTKRLESAFDDVPDLNTDPWHLTYCKVKKAWEAAGGRDRIDWGDISVGQIDTGYTQHPAFGFGLPGQPFIKTALAKTFMRAPQPAPGVDPLTGGNGGHGTGSGSLINGWDPQNNYFGVAPRVPLVPVRINDCVVIDKRAKAFEEAVHHLVDEAKVQVINVSMGTFLVPDAPERFARAVDHAYEKGVILVAAAGNVPVRGWPAYPAYLPRAIALAGITPQSNRWFLSSSGDRVDFSAPAEDIVLAAAVPAGAAGSPLYKRALGGTTFATAITSGAAALWLKVHAAHIDANYTQPWQRIEAFRAMARKTAQKPKGWDAENGLGAGVLNVGKLMNPTFLPAASRLKKR
jgi:hypothetical protein